jgi:hypothetical protein
MFDSALVELFSFLPNVNPPKVLEPPGVAPSVVPDEPKVNGVTIDEDVEVSAILYLLSCCCSPKDPAVDTSFIDDDALVPKEKLPVEGFLDSFSVEVVVALPLVLPNEKEGFSAEDFVT